ncbi:MAG: competence/damage-inducible protein A [Alphaproteobacteria bacterium]|nr:competence/damage-inducible protein A [Alphaproteobacteria bacterium]MAS45879.1 competence/damage-inducible protein A [Alphaproteobacteria bacterium]MAX95939.1 competence/damage-inducible protein A [Alphaproteobacteria bacterium]MBN52956.1 competence/damage-inducible protein A [Alphaproteobacteria bacterium]|tara:strand:+ start:18834 stop:19604 length:771 start_codon:yes stop_codon:yes gene_type:complete
MTKRVEAAFIIIGNEILSGRTQDANLAWLAARLNGIGIAVAECRIIPDIETRIIDTVREMSERFDYVFTSGGIGPTHDDITAAAIAKAFDTVLERNAEAVSRLEVHYGDPAELTAPRLKMAEIPVGATLIDNPVSAAPGFRIANVHVLAGVPKIFQAMIDGILPALTGGAPVISRTVVSDLPESAIAELLGRIERAHNGVEVGSYPYFKLGQGGVSVVVRSTEQSAVDAAARAVFEGIEALGGKPAYLDPGLKQPA